MNKKKRRGYREGSICQRPDGSWRAMVTVGYDANGKRLRKEVCGKTKGEVQDKLTKLQNDKLQGTLCETGRLTVAQYLEQWLNAVRPTLADGTVSNYDRVIRLQINPRLGGVQLAKLTPLQVQGLYGTMQREGHSAEKQRLTHIVLRLALDRAVKWGPIPRNVCDAAESPTITESIKFRVLTKDQVEKLLETADGDRLEALYIVAVTTGMRLGELFGLEWANVNLDQGYIQVTHILNEVHGKLKIKEPKTASSRRRIDLPNVAIDALKQHRKRMTAEGHTSKFVFVNEHGGWWRRTHFHNQCFQPLLAKAGLPRIRFHDLRHTCATLLLQDDVHPK